MACGGAFLRDGVALADSNSELGDAIGDWASVSLLGATEGWLVHAPLAAVQGRRERRQCSTRSQHPS